MTTRALRQSPAALPLARAAALAIAAFGVWAILHLGAIASAVTPVTLVGPDLQPKRIHLTSVRDGRIGYFDENRALRNAALSDFVQLRGFPAPPATDPAVTEDGVEPPGMIELIDGTRLTGRLSGVAEDGQSLQWTHDALGTIDVTLDALAALALREALGRVEQPASDQAVLINGDVIVGFMERLVALRVEGAADPIEAPLDRLAKVVTTNPRHAPALDRVQFEDGTRLAVRSFSANADELRLEAVWPEGVKGQTGATVWPLHAVRRVDLAQAGLELVTLADLPMRVVAGGSVFGVPWPPRAIDDVLHLHAPVTIEIELPSGASRVAAAVELALDDVPAHARGWADCFVNVSTAGGAAHQVHLHAASPRGTINVPVSGTTLTIEIDAGAHGPLLDRVRLTDAIVLVRQAAP
jgi:hypothetical protein